MSGFVVARDRPHRRAIRRVSGWTRDYLRRAALADLGCVILGVFAAAELRSGNDVTGTYRALSFALPGVWLVAIWLVWGYDVRFNVIGSAEFRKVLNAAPGLFRLDRRYVENWSFALRPPTHVEDRLNAGSEGWRLLTDSSASRNG